jgi:hypothetical protein
MTDDATQLRDKNGVPIYKGDLLRTFHYYGARKRKNFLYHTVVEKNGYLIMTPTCHLEPSLVSGGGECRLKAGLDSSSEVIAGHGPEPYLSFRERPRMKDVKA